MMTIEKFYQVLFLELLERHFREWIRTRISDDGGTEYLGQIGNWHLANFSFRDTIRRHKNSSNTNKLLTDETEEIIPLKVKNKIC